MKQAKQTPPQAPSRGLSRRGFLKSSFVAAAPLVFSSRCYGESPNEMLNLAAVGVGGKGWSDLESSARGMNVRVVALCDVDANNLGRAAEKYQDAATFADYRRMFEKMESDIDAVLVSTPDHMHAPIALAAMSLGKHVHVQKPLSNSLDDLRAMQQMAAENPHLVTQMGTQIHSHESYRTATEMIRSGAIGKVSEAHLWVSKSWAGPKAGRPDQTDPVPQHLDWDLWLGASPERPYVDKIYHPGQWRGWKDFGAGTLGDMGCHIFDPVFSALDLGTPTSLISRGPQHYDETFAPDSDVTYQFEGTPYTTEKLKFRWTDGSGASRPDASLASLPPETNLPGAGAFLIGEQGVMVLPHWSLPSFYVNNENMDITVESLGNNDHYTEFTDACRGVGETSTPFSYACRVTEAVLTGVVAGSFPNRELTWDSAALRFDYDPANEQVERQYREGWQPAQLVR